ncbi:TolC family protein [candidate division KSB1 bacterium]|nr:TolC family protein [candidate division KSB1 bacterium]
MKFLLINRSHRQCRKQILLVIIICLAIVTLFTHSFANGPDGEERNVVTVRTSDKDVHHEILFNEQQVIDSALENNIKLHALQTNSIIAEHRVESSGFFENPELRVSDVSTRYYTHDFDELRVGLRFPVPQLGQLGEEVQQARVELWERKVDQIRYRHEFIAMIRKSFAEVIMYDRLAELNQKRAAKADERIRVIEQLADIGERSVVYLMKEKIWQSESRSDYARAVQYQELARKELMAWSSMPDNAQLVVEDLPTVNQDVDELVAIGIENRPEMKLVEQYIQLARNQKKYEYLKLIPWFSFIDLSYHWEEKRVYDWAEFRAGINLPILNWNQGNIKAARLAVARQHDQYAAVRHAIEEEIRIAYIAYKDMLLDYKNFKLSSEELITEAKTIIEQAQLHKTLMPDELLELEWMILDTEVLLAEKRRELAHALSDLYLSIGIEDHEQLIH